MEKVIVHDELVHAAQQVWEVAGVGQIVTTDPGTRSTTLVGFFIPTWQMNGLGRALGAESRLRPDPRMWVAPFDDAALVDDPFTWRDDLFLLIFLSVVFLAGFGVGWWLL